MINKNGSKVPRREPEVEAEPAEPAACKNGINVIYFFHPRIIESDTPAQNFSNEKFKQVF